MQRTFALPHPLKGDSVAALETQVGPLAPGLRVRVTTSTGALIGTIAPFGAAARRHFGIDTRPIPRDAFKMDTLAARVTITESNNRPCAHAAAEVQSLRLITPAAF